MPQNNPPPLDPPIPDDIPLAGLISIIYRMRNIYTDAQEIAPGLTTGQIPFIMQISREPGTTQDDLAAHSIYDKGTVARATRKLEENGLLTRTPDPDNRRKLRLFLTPEGEAVVPWVLAIDREWEDILLSGISEDDRRTLCQILHRMAVRSRDTVRKDGGDDGTSGDDRCSHTAPPLP